MRKARVEQELLKHNKPLEFEVKDYLKAEEHCVETDLQDLKRKRDGDEGEKKMNGMAGRLG